MVMPGDETRVIDDGPRAEIHEGNMNLVAVGVAGEHEMPGVGKEQVLGVGIVVQDNGGTFAGSAGEGLIGLNFERPEVTDADEVETLELSGIVVE